MSTKTKYSRRGIAALCGAAVLFAGEMEPMVSLAEQTEMDLLSVQEETVSDTNQQGILETQSPETGNAGESFTEASEMTSESSTEDAQTSQEAGSETVQADPGSDVPPTQPETNAESETPSSEKPTESEAGQTEKPTENEADPPQETAPPQTEPGSTLPCMIRIRMMMVPEVMEATAEVPTGTPAGTSHRNTASGRSTR